MSTKANPVVVGSFVIGAMALLIVAILVFGGGRFFEERRTFVTHFEGSLKGLRVGSNVLFRGVRVGFVRDIRVEYDSDTGEFLVPVIFQILPDAMALLDQDDRPLLPGRTSARIEELIRQGLRTRLEIDSFVTGQLVVELDFRPETPVKLYGIPGDIPEIPSVPSNIQQVLERFQTFVTEIQERVELDELVSGVIGALAGINALVNSEDLHGALAGLNRLANLEELRDIPAAVLVTLGEFDKTVADARILLATTDRNMESLVARAEHSLDGLSALMREAGELLESLSEQVSADSELNFQLRRTLEESQAAARSLRHLVEFLDRNPEALLRGRREIRE